MAAYHKVEVSLNTNAVEVGIPSPQTVNVVVPTIGPAGPTGSVGPVGPTGPQGVPGTGLEVLTTQGDLLYQGASTGQRLAIGTSGQILRVANGIPSWGNESGAVTSVNGETGAVTITAASIDAAADNHTHSFSDINVNGVLISGAGNANANGPYLYSGDFGDRGAYHKDKDSLIYWDGDAWLINVNGDDRYSSTQDVSFPYQVTSWSVLPGTGTAPAPTSNARLSGQEFEEIVGQRVNPTLRGDAAGKNVGTGANDVAAGNDSRFTDARQPLSHSSTHHTGGTDALELASLAATGAGADDILASDGDGAASWRTLSTFIGESVGPADIGAAQASHTHGNLTNAGAIGTTANLPLKTGTNGVVEAGSFGTAAGSFCAGDDVRLSDDRDPNAHAASHLPDGADEIFDQSLNTTDSVTFLNLHIDGGDLTGVGQLAFDSGAGQSVTISEAEISFTGAAAATTLTNIGAAASGSITSSGLTQSTARILGRTTASTGAVEEIQIGSGLSLSAGELSATGSGVTAVGASTADVLSVSGSDLVADDPNADRIVFWDDSESKLRYLEAGSGLSISGTTMTVTATGGATNLWIPASAWIPKTTAGCGVDSRETTTNDQNFDELLFDTGSDEFADALVVMPSNYNNGTITARFYWTAASGSGTVEWAIQGRAFANDDALDTAAGTKQAVNDTLIAANDMHITSATSACTIGGTPAANTPIQFTIYRDVSEDTLAVDARLLGVEIIFN
jgi:hypothetical protein